VRDDRKNSFDLALKRPKKADRWEILGASWTNGGEVSENAGRVFFQMGSALYYCSASVIDDSVSDRSIILTAAHCVYDETSGTGFATNWMFVPDFDANPVAMTGLFCETTTRGCWTADAIVVSDSYATAGSFNEAAVLHDYAFVVVKYGGKNDTQLDNEVGTVSNCGYSRTRSTASIETLFHSLNET
jgi:hypothetical protein